MNPSIEKIEISGLSINARVWGPKDGKKVLALHGWLDNAASFDVLAPLLPDYRIVAIDFPGHGYSDFLPHGMSYHHFDRIVHTARVAKALGWSRFSVIGHSMGGIVGTLLSAVYPSMIDKLVLLDILWYTTRPASDALMGLKNFVIDAQKTMRQHTVYESIEQAAKIRTMVDPLLTLSEKSATILTKGGFAKVDKGYSWTFDQRLLKMSLNLYTEEQVKVILKSIESEMCLLIASDGIMKKPGLMERIALLKNKEVHELEGGHYLHMDTPEPVAKIIKEFLNH